MTNGYTVFSFPALANKIKQTFSHISLTLHTTQGAKTSLPPSIVKNAYWSAHPSAWPKRVTQINTHIKNKLLRNIFFQIIFLSTKSKLPLLKPTCCCWSVIQSYPTLLNPTDCSIPGLPVLHHLLKFARVYVHCISDAIKPSHPLTPSSPALNLSQHQGLFQRVGCSHQMTKILELQLQHQSSQRVCRVDIL